MKLLVDIPDDVALALADDHDDVATAMNEAAKLYLALENPDECLADPDLDERRGVLPP